MDYKIIFGYLSLIVAFASYYIYLRAIYKGETKPHAFTWFVWGVLNVVAFLAVWVSGGEAGSWVLAMNAVLCLVIAGIGVWQRHVQYDFRDWLSLFGAIVGIILWRLTHDPLYAVILISISDLMGIVPSIRKAWKMPFEENLSSWFLGLLYYPLGIIALQSLTLTTWLYPASIMVADTTLILVIIFQRKKKGSLFIKDSI